MPQETMTSRERWQAVLHRDKPDRVPMDYWATEEASEKLVRHLGCRDLEEALAQLHVDRPLTVGPRYTGPEPKAGQDVFGCRHRNVRYRDGTYRECVHHPWAGFESVAQIEKEYTWPEPDWWDYAHIPGQVAGHEDKPIRGGGSEPFLTYCQLRGQEQAYMDLALHPDIVHYALDRLFDLAYENTRRIYEQIPGQVMITYVAEDLGSQESLLFSLQHIRAFLLPRMKRMMDLAHEAGAYVFTHSDGSVRDVIPDFIQTGTDVLNPVQWRCQGMERTALKRDFGDQLVFHGAMDNQQTLPFGSVEDVRQEVLDNLRMLNSDGGYILAPCHNIQAVGPAENVVAMYQTCYEHGWM